MVPSHGKTKELAGNFHMKFYSGPVPHKNGFDGLSVDWLVRLFILNN